MSTFASPVAEGCTKDEATDDTDMDRAGEAGLAGANVDGEAGKLDAPGSETLRDIAGAADATGVAFGVDCWEDTTEVLIAMGAGVALFVSGLGWIWPSSPGEKERAEQKPSEDVIRRVRPSLDQARSVKVAKCRLLTMTSGLDCCVS
jgi:hypothetical protein